MLFSEFDGTNLKITRIQVSNSLTAQVAIILPIQISIPVPNTFQFEEITGCSESLVAIKYSDATQSMINIFKYDTGSTVVKSFTSGKAFHRLMFIGEVEAIRSVDEQD